MNASRPAQRLLERVCAVIVVLGVLYAALLPLIADGTALLSTYKRGGLIPLIIIFAGACAGWLCLRLARSRKRPPTVLVVVGGVCAVGLLAVMWWTTRGTVEEQRVTPSPTSGRFHQSAPSDNTPGTVTPPAPPSAGP